MIIEEIKKMTKGILYWIISVFIISFVFLAPILAGKSIVVFVFERVAKDLVPRNVQLVATDPLGAFIAHIIIALSLAIITLSPFIIYSIARYLSSALTNKEKKGLIITILPSIILFILGCIFAYYILIPTIFSVLYGFASVVGIMELFSVRDFIHLVFGIMIATGVIFLLPIFMFLLSKIGFVGRKFWLNKWRHALVFCLAFSAIVTPDGTGITMLILAFPVFFLYGIGCIIT